MIADDAQGLPASVAVDWVLTGDWGSASVDIALYTELLALLSGPDEPSVREGLAMYEPLSTPVATAWALLARGVVLSEGGVISLKEDSVIGHRVPQRFQPEVALRALCGEMWSEGGQARLANCADLSLAVPTLRSLYVFEGYWMQDAPPPELQRLDLSGCPSLESLVGIAELGHLEELRLPAARKALLTPNLANLPPWISVIWCPDTCTASLSTGALYIYNVWNDDLSLDEWTYDPMEALTIRGKYQASRHDEAFVTRYAEDARGNVNTTDGFIRMSDAALVAATAHQRPEVP